MKILHNARIHTLDPVRPLASALAIDAGRIVALGADELLSRYDRAEKQDMGGRVVLPGLIDAHLHLHYYALSLQKIDCETDTLAECLRRVEMRVASSDSGGWILGHGWNQNTWGGAWPHAADLDRLAPDHPVYLTAKSLHAAWANTVALRLAGITPATPDPKDGRIQRDEQGQPTGILLENAMLLVGDIVPEPDVKGLADAIDRAQPILWKMGLTGVHDFDRRESFMALQQLHADDRLKLRVTKNIPVDLLDHAVALGLRTGFGDDWLRIGSVKVFMDGALGPRTAAMFQPYDGEPDNRGILNLDGEQLFELGRRAAGTGLGMTVHAIGDRANHEVLDAYEHLRAHEAENGLPHLRHRIEHVQLLHPSDVPRLARLNVIASMQPIHATSDMLMADKYWGERTSYAYALRSQLDSGAHVAFGSDAPVESPNPFWGIHAAVTRRRANGAPGPAGWRPEQRLSMQQAIEGFTTGPAFAAYAEDRQGRLAPGCFADLIVLEKDPFTVDPAEVKDFQSSATMVGGDWVYEA
ncbi:MAG TPA: amidohydrolase [Anaerolineales bacterium]|nr:amidohydrolase [Anaerolineales bacterium]